MISHTPVSLVKVTIASTRIKFNRFGKSNLCDSLSNDKCFFLHHQTFLTNIFSNIVLLTNIFLSSCFCLYFILFFFLLFSRVFFFSPKDPYFSFTCRDLWMRENKCRNLAVLKSCCNEALKENSLSSLGLVYCYWRRTSRTIFCQADTKSTWKFWISFTTLIHIHMHLREKNAETSGRVKKRKKAALKILGLVILAEIVRRHFNWVYYTRS